MCVCRELGILFRIVTSQNCGSLFRRVLMQGSGSLLRIILHQANDSLFRTIVSQFRNKQQKTTENMQNQHLLNFQSILIVEYFVQ